MNDWDRTLSHDYADEREPEPLVEWWPPVAHRTPEHCPTCLQRPCVCHNVRHEDTVQEGNIIAENVGAGRERKDIDD